MMASITYLLPVERQLELECSRDGSKVQVRTQLTVAPRALPLATLEHASLSRGDWHGEG